MKELGGCYIHFLKSASDATFERERECGKRRLTNVDVPVITPVSHPSPSCSQSVIACRLQ